MGSIAVQPLYPGEIGQLAVGGCVTPGYFNAPELNAEAFGELAGDFRSRLGESMLGMTIRPAKNLALCDVASEN